MKFPLVSLIFLEISLVFPILLFPSISLHCSLKVFFTSPCLFKRCLHIKSLETANMLLTRQKGFCRCNKVELLKREIITDYSSGFNIIVWILTNWAFSSWKPERSSKRKPRDSKYEKDSTYCCWLWRWKRSQIRKCEQPLEAEYSQSTVSKEIETQAYNCMELNFPPTWMYLKVIFPLSLQLRVQAG